MAASLGVRLKGHVMAFPERSRRDREAFMSLVLWYYSPSHHKSHKSINWLRCSRMYIIPKEFIAITVSDRGHVME